MDKKLIKDIVISLISITVITIITLGSMIFYHSFLKFTIPKSEIDYTYSGIIGLSQMGITSFATDLLRAVEKHEIPHNPMNVESVINVIQPQFQPYVKQAYPLIDIPTHASMVKQSNIERLKATMIDQIDIDGLQSLSIDGLNLLELL